MIGFVKINNIIVIFNKFVINRILTSVNSLSQQSLVDMLPQNTSSENKQVQTIPEKPVKRYLKSSFINVFIRETIISKFSLKSNYKLIQQTHIYI